jgi:hypothetical protein
LAILSRIGGRVCAEEVAARINNPQNSGRRIAVLQRKVVMHVLVPEFDDFDDGRGLQNSDGYVTNTLVAHPAPERLRKMQPQ